MIGYIKIYRQMKNWGWYTDIPVKVLFLHLLLSANREAREWNGIKIEQGQLITSLEHLARDSGLTVQQVRTALKKLKSTQEATYKSTSRNTIITINNWDKFQLSNTNCNKQITNEQQTNNKQITTNKKERIEEDKNSFFIEEKKTKKIDPFMNKTKDVFVSEYEKIFKKKVFLSHSDHMRLVELSAEYEDFKELIPTALKKLRAINFNEINFTPTASWLLKGNNFERVMNGEFETKKAISRPTERTFKTFELSEEEKRESEEAGKKALEQMKKIFRKGD